MRRDCRGSHALGVQGPSRMGQEVTLRAHLQYHHEQGGGLAEGDGRFQTDCFRTPRLTGEGRSVAFPLPAPLYIHRSLTNLVFYDFIQEDANVLSFSISLEVSHKSANTRCSSAWSGLNFSGGQIAMAKA